MGGAHGSGFNRLSGSGPVKEVTQGGGITGITAFLCFTFVYIIFLSFQRSGTETPDDVPLNTWPRQKYVKELFDNFF